MSEQAAKLAAIAGSVRDSYLDAGLAEAGIAAVNDDCRIELTYPYPAATEAQRAADAIRAAAKAAGLAEPAIGTRMRILRRLAQGGAQPVAGIRNIIAVSSAKGGVGKSTIAANLALALAAEGARAGLLDADIYGPSVPTMLGGDRPQADENSRIIPLRLHGIQAISMGHLVDPGQAMIWRGPMVIKALEQLLREVAWEDLDFLVLDMPPGTGDIQLSVAQKVPVAGAIVVTTPQALALADAVRGLGMFNRVSVPVLGFIENMSHFACPDCGAQHALFGTGAGEVLENEHGLRRLASLPLDPALGTSSDEGIPLAASQPDSQLALQFRRTASLIGALVSQRDPDQGEKFPPIVPAS